MKVAIVGATGLVGSEMIKVLEESTIEVSSIVPLASSRSVGKKITFKNQEVEVKDLQNWESLDFDYALFSAGGNVSLEYAPKMAAKGIVVIDNSSAFRMKQEVPLVVPSVNSFHLKSTSKIIANPNCSTIQLVMVLGALIKLSDIKRIVVSTYQSVSGAGYEGINELINNTKSRIMNNGIVSTEKFKHNIDLNCIPHIDVFLDNGYTKEEEKMIKETSKIMGKEIPFTATCVRVPTITGHAESVNIEFSNELEIEDIINCLKNDETIVIQDNPSLNEYPINSESKGSDKTFVGRIRKDFSKENSINLWVVADNLRVGAASNAVAILQKYIELNKN